MNWLRYLPFVVLSGLLVSRSAPAEAAPPAGMDDVSGDDARLQFVAQATTDDDAQRALVVQKMSLLEAYLKSGSLARAREADNAEAAAAVKDAESQLQQARADFDRDRLQPAAEALDKGLKQASLAASLAARPTVNPAKQKQQYDRLRGQIASYLDTIGGSTGRGSDETFARIDGMVAAADKLAAAGKYDDANKRLTEAYHVTVGLVTRLRTGTTLVSSLEFETPEQELDYERRRNESYEMLVTIMMADHPDGSGTLQVMADRQIKESRGLRAEAERLAVRGEFAAAIQRMEEATTRLVRVLQAGGLPIPE